jgi:hypothetical protein
LFAQPRPSVAATSPVGIGAAAAVALLMALGLAAVAVHDAPAGGGAARAFLAAQRRSLLATWVVEERFTRVVSARPGQPLTESIHHAQRPPDHLIVAPGSVDSVFRGRRLACGVGPDGQQHCRDAGLALPYREQVDTTMTNLATYVLGGRPPYLVSDAGRGCYLLRLRAGRVESSTFGTRSEFCFDPATSAPVRVEIDRSQGQDVTVAVSVSSTVTDQDLTPPA